MCWIPFSAERTKISLDVCKKKFNLANNEHPTTHKYPYKDINTFLQMKCPATGDCSYFELTFEKFPRCLCDSNDCILHILGEWTHAYTCSRTELHFSITPHVHSHSPFWVCMRYCTTKQETHTHIHTYTCNYIQRCRAVILWQQNSVILVYNLCV